MGFSVTSDECSGWAFREVELLDPRRPSGKTVRITKDRGLWGVEVSVEGDGFHGPHEVLLALDARPFESRAMSHEETLAATLEAVARMPSSEAEMATLRARLRKYREDYTRRMSGRDRDLEDARRHFDAGDFRAAVSAYARLSDAELTRADQMRARIAQDRTEAS